MIIESWRTFDNGFWGITILVVENGVGAQLPWVLGNNNFRHPRILDNGFFYNKHYDQ